MLTKYNAHVSLTDALPLSDPAVVGTHHRYDATTVKIKQQTLSQSVWYAPALCTITAAGHQLTNVVLSTSLSLGEI